MRFFLSFFYKKKAVYSQTTFVLLLILYFSILSFSYIYYTQGVEDFKILQLKDNNIRVYSHLQDPIIKTVFLENQTIKLPSESFAKESIIILNQSSITVITTDNTLYQEDIFSLYGPRFCQSYEIYLELDASLFFNGTCISYTSS